jgi:hypothetical protein
VATTFYYSVSNDLVAQIEPPVRTCHARDLFNEIEDDALLSAPIQLTVDEDAITIIFNPAGGDLSGGQEDALDAVIAAHEGYWPYLPIDRHYASVNASSSSSSSKTVPAGQRWLITSFTGSGGDDTRSALYWDYGGGDQRILAHTYGDTTIALNEQVLGDGATALSIVLVNGALVSKPCGGRYEGEIVTSGSTGSAIDPGGGQGQD